MTAPGLRSFLARSTALTGLTVRGSAPPRPRRAAGLASALDAIALEAWVFTGALALDLLLGDVHSLKEKRSVVRPIVAELRRKFERQRRRGRAPRPAPAGAGRRGRRGGGRRPLREVLDGVRAARRRTSRGRGAVRLHPAAQLHR